jgi:hypothetical protein
MFPVSLFPIFCSSLFLSPHYFAYIIHIIKKHVVKNSGTTSGDKIVIVVTRILITIMMSL